MNLEQDRSRARHEVPTRRHRARLGSVAALVLVLSAVVPAVSDGARRSLMYQLPVDRLEAFAFEVDMMTETRLVKRPGDSDRYDLAPVEARLSAVRTQGRGRLERVLARVFRDDSLGLIARVVDLEGRVSRGEDDEGQPLDLSSLEGKSVALRLHASGELLDSHGWQHLLGAGRPASVLGDLFLQSILRLPSHPPRGTDQVGVTFRTRVPVDGSLQRDRTWSLSFTRMDAPGACGRRCVAMRYEGEGVERSRDTHPSRPSELSGKGRVSGEIVLRGRRGSLFSHRWTSRWTSTLKSRGPEGEPRGRVVQELQEEGSLQSVPPAARIEAVGGGDAVDDGEAGR